jgi:hypothetical protein
MTSFTNITNKTDPKTDFWELNPQIQYFSPFNKLKDEFKDSSQHMWAIFFMSDPDEDINRFYRYDLQKRRDNINNFYPDIKWEDPLFQECLEAYPFECMNAIHRALKDELDSLKLRAKLISDTPPTLDYTDIDNGRAINIKGTAIQLDKMRKDTSKIYDALEEARNKFVKQKDEEVRVRGGRKESYSERKKV